MVSRLGKKVSEIPVRKGQYVEVAISSYNRLQEIWGDDAEIFNPFRWLDNRNTNHAEGALGPYANVYVTVMFTSFQQSYLIPHQAYVHWWAPDMHWVRRIRYFICPKSI